ncbi:MAG: hypothetical protein FWF31_01835 [Desulfobulbus sp.]|nr:hypothetical protein [Desulfobulbus sp.]
MRKLTLFAPLAVLLTAATAFAVGSMVDYCQAPASISGSPAPNVLLVVNASASMNELAYPRIDGAGNEIGYNPNTLYEGYFDPRKNYTLAGDGYIEDDKVVDGCLLQCADNHMECVDSTFGYTGCGGKNSGGCKGGQYPCCTLWETVPGSCGAYDAEGAFGNGNYLNWLHMTRIDVLRWALTGGAPAGCGGNHNSQQECDVSGFKESNSKVPCTGNGADVGGCTLGTSNGIQLMARWDRLTGESGGLLYQLKNLSVQPRIGIMLYQGSGVVEYTYIGDFRASTNASSDDAVNQYKNTIAKLNAQAPAGDAATAPALWAAYAYFSQRSSVFGSPSPQTGGGGGSAANNPMYQCIDKNGDGICQGNEVVPIPCAKNFMILLSDGGWNMGGQPPPVSTCSIDTGYNYSTGYTMGGYSADPVVAAYNLHKEGFLNLPLSVNSRVETIYTLGLWLSPRGDNAMKQIALYGGFDTNKTWPSNLTDFPRDSCVADYCSAKAKGSLCAAMPPSSPDWDKDGDGVPDNHLSASSATEIKNKIIAIIMDLMKKASSGTALSVLGSSEGSGAVMIQTLFYPKRVFNNGEVTWTSDLMNYWYYLDPFFTGMNIYEDTVREGGDFSLLDLTQDYITSFDYQAGEGLTVASLWQNGVRKGQRSLELSRAVWRSGFNLWWTKPAERTVYTSRNGSELLSFTPANSSLLAPYFDLSDTDAKTLIDYVLGYDCTNAGVGCVCGEPGCDKKIGRNRTVTTGVCSLSRAPCEDDTNCPAASGETCVQETHVWKMGDIISATPRTMSSGPLNAFNLTSPYGFNDRSYDQFVKSNDYRDRQLVFSGTNGGMLHAFKLGKLLQTWSGKTPYQAAKLEGSTGPGGIGTEAWGYIPKNVLPYLQFLKEDSYCHIYMVDGPLTLTDASINCSLTNYWDCPKATTMLTADSNDLNFDSTSWRSVLVGSMGIGGATCATINPTVSPKGVAAPLADTSKGWSSYFALDVTNQTSPKPLWEFSHPNLGVTNVGAGIVKTGGNRGECSNNIAVSCLLDSDCYGGKCNATIGETNGRWFAVLASGSTGPISSNEFKGASNQTLKLFILDLKTGDLLRTIDTGITKAFAGSISNSILDFEKDLPNSVGNYQDDVLYVGYIQDIGGSNQGGVLRLAINDNIDPAKWTWSKVFADGELGPVTGAVVSLIDRKNQTLWMYFGEGRYFYKEDDLAAQRRLFGVQDTCFDWETRSLKSTCTEMRVATDLQNQTAPVMWDMSKKGWYILLDAANSESGTSAERVVVSPVIDPQGVIYYASFAPNTDVCSFGGLSYIWSVDYKTGDVPKIQGGASRGKTIVQTSTGAVQTVSITDGRRSASIPGQIPGGINRFTPPGPVRQFLHIQEE